MTGKKNANRTAVALGNFDGMHVGHTAVLDAAKSFRKDGLAPVALLFDEHSIKAITGNAPPMLMTVGERNEFIEKYGMQDMYSAGFYPFETEEERWAYWCRHSYVNRIEPPAMPLYKHLFEMVKDKDYFVLTTNVDHQFQKAGFQDEKIFATQGDYGLIQCMKGCHPKTYDAISMFTQMNQAQKNCKIPSYMVPRCPVCGGPMAMNLRCDQYFVEDDAWNQAAENYGKYLKKMKKGKVLLLELGVGFNTPMIIRFPFEKLVREHKNMKLVRLNRDEAVIPESFGSRGIGINRDLCESLSDIKKSI